MDRRMSRRLACLSVVLALALPPAGPAAAAEPGPYASQCAACHQANGRGGPIAPRLAGRAGAAARTSSGRSYLIGVLLHGLSGPLTVDGRAMNGVMPAYAHLTDAEVAAALNDLLRFGPTPIPRAFTAHEVAAQRRLEARPPGAMAAARRRLPPSPGF